jgi:hypothetical protein
MRRERRFDSVALDCGLANSFTFFISYYYYNYDYYDPSIHSELPGMPEIPVHGDLDDNGTQGVVGLQVLRYQETVKLYPGARKVLHELATNPKYKDITIATASSSLEPSYSYACLDGIEILPGVVMGDLMR